MKLKTLLKRHVRDRHIWHPTWPNPYTYIPPQRESWATLKKRNKSPLLLCRMPGLQMATPVVLNDDWIKYIR